MGTNRLQNKPTDISKALIQAETIAEQIKHSASIGETAKVFDMTSYDNSTLNYCIYFDNDWEQMKAPSSNIILVTSSIDKNENGRMVSATIEAFNCKDVDSIKDREALVELTAKKWVNGN
jgi:hypothetical protein